MKTFKIIEIIQVLLEGEETPTQHFKEEILELHFNLQNAEGQSSLCLSISDDGETILVDQNHLWKPATTIQNWPWLTEKVPPTHELAGLCGDTIEKIQYGIGKTLDTHHEVIYYFKISTDQREFLFFNNGDQGGFSFDRIEEILQEDIYGFEWRDGPPVIYL